MSRPRRCSCGGCAYCLARDRANQYRKNAEMRRWKESGGAPIEPTTPSVKYPIQLTIWETSDNNWHNDELSAYKHQLSLFMLDRENKS